MKTTTLKAPENIDAILMDSGFNKNGYDYWRNLPLTDFKNNWDEEVYISLTPNGYEVWYPDRENKNKLFKTETGLIKYCKRNHLIN